MLRDFRGAEFGDDRLTKRLLRIVEGLAPDPSASFPEAAGTDAALEGTYRFFQNESVSPQQILAPHVAATVVRAEKLPLIIVAHDTTEFSFTTPRDGLGRINDAGRGFFGHFALALDPSSRRPLGILGLQTLTRIAAPRKDHHTEHLPEEDRESFRWRSLVADVGSVLRGRAEAIHVMDSEADAYALLDAMVAEEHRFVVRLKHDRTVTDETGERVRLDEKLPSLTGRFTRQVQLSTRAAPHRGGPSRKRNTARTARDVTLEFAATEVLVHRPSSERKGAASLRLHIVHVREVAPPPGVEPVDWKLITTEPIDTPAELERIVDAYRARWLIEEFFKALKTGCAYEKRQLESLSALLNALALFGPIACQLLLLRNTARDEPKTPATAILGRLELLVLQRHKSTALPDRASARDAMLAIARLGGHITNNGEPGWIVLGRGYEKLLALAEGARLALKL